MAEKRERAVRVWQPNTTQYKVIRIVSHTPIRRKSKKQIIAVKAITFAAAILAIYGLLLLEFHFAAGVVIFGLTFTYLMAFAWANGGFR